MRLWYRWKRLWSNLWEDERGIGTVEMILIFKSKLTSLVNEIFDKITSQSRLV